MEFRRQEDGISVTVKKKDEGERPMPSEGGGGPERDGGEGGKLKPSQDAMTDDTSGSNSA